MKTTAVQGSTRNETLPQLYSPFLSTVYYLLVQHYWRGITLLYRDTVLPQKYWWGITPRWGGPGLGITCGYCTYGLIEAAVLEE